MELGPDTNYHGGETSSVVNKEVYIWSVQKGIELGLQKGEEGANISELALKPDTQAEVRVVDNGAA